MTENTTDSGAIEPKDSVQDQKDASGSNDQTKQEDLVAYDTYRRTLGEAKKYKSETAELKAKLEQYEQARLEEEGKFKEIADSERKRAAEYEGKFKQLEATIAEERIRSQIELKAKEMGCVDTDALTKLMDLQNLDVVDGYKVSPQSLEMALNKAKQDKSYLFSKPAPSIQDGAPVTSEYTDKKGLEGLTLQERAKLYFNKAK